jgi:hypothetical protein
MEPVVVAMPVVSALLGAGLGYAATRRVSALLGVGLAVATLLVALALVLTAQGRPGFDGIGPLLLGVLILGPAGLAVALGTVIAAVVAARGRDR